MDMLSLFDLGLFGGRIDPFGATAELLALRNPDRRLSSGGRNQRDARCVTYMAAAGGLEHRTC
jgi:hypothetical protein